MADNALTPESNILLYSSEDGSLRIQVRVQDETVWLTQQAMAELFQTTKQNIGQHLKNIFEENELQEDSVVKNFFTTARDGKKYATNYYNLDAILSVGYRVKSHVATKFRQWATQRLREYIVKGFAMDDERLKQAGGGDYFDELLARIRDIRSSEKVFWRKVLEIYATSIDYDPAVDASREFFSIVQNKMHWGAHGHTAAEIIYSRADADKPHMGLTSWTGLSLKKTDAAIAKNYLKADELNALNRIVTMYLDYAELQALNKKPMHMQDWITKLDDFLKFNEQDILSHAGAVSHNAALEKAAKEYEKYQKLHAQDITPVENHFIEAVKEVKQLESKKKSGKKAKGKPNG